VLFSYQKVFKDPFGFDIRKLPYIDTQITVYQIFVNNIFIDMIWFLLLRIGTKIYVKSGMPC